jgi:hypothetical protein
MEPNITQQEIERTLNSLDGLSRAEMPPFFYTRLQTRLYQKPAAPWLAGKPVFSFVTVCLLLLLNIATINYLVRTEAAGGIQSFAQEYGLSVSTVYNDKTAGK